MKLRFIQTQWLSGGLMLAWMAIDGRGGLRLFNAALAAILISSAIGSEIYTRWKRARSRAQAVDEALRA